MDSHLAGLARGGEGWRAGGRLPDATDVEI